MTEKEEGEVSPEPSTENSAPPSRGDEWVKKTSRGGNMSLMTVQKRYVRHICNVGEYVLTCTRNQLASRPVPPRKPKVPANVEVLHSTSEGSAGAETKRVVVDGVIFQFEEGGSKLVRIGGG